MPIFEVSISRSFVIKVEAKSARDATEAAQFFLGYKDDSTKIEKEKHGFDFKEMDMICNDVLSVNRVED